MISSILRRMSVFAAVAIWALAATILFRDVQILTFETIATAWRSVPVSKIGFSLMLTGISFIALGAYDVIATRVIVPTRVPAALAWFGGAAGNAVSNTVGFHAVTGPLVRYRLYRRAGLSLMDVATIMGFSWATLALGFITVFALALLSGDSGSARTFAGAGLIAILGLLLAWLGPRGRNLSWLGLSLPLASSGTTAAQMAIGALEMLAAIGALYVVMPEIPVTFAGFAAAYIGAILLGIVSHAPGGVGVFEAAMLSFTGGHDKAGVLAALMLYRLVYNLMPFALAVLALAGFEVLARCKSQFDGG